MKVILKRYSIPLAITCLLLSAQVRAEDPRVEKKKTYNKSYDVSSRDKISLSNQFGEMQINAWDKNEVKAAITITAEASTDENAQAILDQITIEDGKDGEGIFFKTKIANKNNNKIGKGEKTSFRINYVVYVPSRNALVAKNAFGPMSIGDHSGELTLESKFGSLTAGKLSNVKNVEIEFGKTPSTISSISNGNLMIKFSKAVVENLDGSVNATLEFCDVAKLKIDNSIKSLNIKNKFSTLFLDVTNNLSANFNISTNFGDLHNKTNFEIKEDGEDDDRHGPRFNKRYTGKAGGGSTEFKIKSEFSEITLGHNLVVDFNKNYKKERDRNRERDQDRDKNRNSNTNRNKNAQVSI